MEHILQYFTLVSCVVLKEGMVLQRIHSENFLSHGAN